MRTLPFGDHRIVSSITFNVNGRQLSLIFFFLLSFLGYTSRIVYTYSLVYTLFTSSVLDSTFYIEQWTNIHDFLRELAHQSVRGERCHISKKKKKGKTRGPPPFVHVSSRALCLLPAFQLNSNCHDSESQTNKFQFNFDLDATFKLPR